MPSEAVTKRERVLNILTLPGISPDIANLQAEDAVIGAVLQNPDCFLTLGDTVQAGDFTQPFNAYTWHVFDVLAQDMQPIDLQTVADKLVTFEMLEVDRAGAIERLGVLMGSTPNASNVQAHARSVLDASCRLRVIKAAAEITTHARKKDMPVELLKDYADTTMSKAVEQMVQGSVTARDRMADFQELVRERSLNNIPVQVDTGFDILTIEQRKVTVMAGFSGTGKTTLALSVIRNVCKKNKTDAVIHISFEMGGTDEVMQEIAAMETGIWRQKLKSGALTSEEWRKLVLQGEEVSSWNLHIFDNQDIPTRSPANITRKIRQVQKRSRVQLVVIDGLWLMYSDQSVTGTDGREGWMVQQENIDKLVNMARILDVPILVLHQYNAEFRNASEPSPTLLMGGQRIHNTPQHICALWRKSEDKSSLLYDLKHRGGVQIEEPMKLRYNRQFARYEMPTEDDTDDDQG